MLNIFCKKRSSQEWFEREPDTLQILDPDGWDRSDLEQSWEEKITYKEFQKRLMKSTCLIVTKKI